MSDDLERILQEDGVALEEEMMIISHQIVARLVGKYKSQRYRVCPCCDRVQVLGVTSWESAHQADCPFRAYLERLGEPLD